MAYRAIVLPVCHGDITVTTVVSPDWAIEKPTDCLSVVEELQPQTIKSDTSSIASGALRLVIIVHILVFTRFILVRMFVFVVVNILAIAMITTMIRAIAIAVALAVTIFLTLVMLYLSTMSFLQYST